MVHVAYPPLQLIAFPLYAFLLPIYSFWHMDDFSWGNTRVVVGEKGNMKVVAGTDDDPFDDAMIPRKRFSEYQQEILNAGEAPHDTLLYDPRRATHIATPDPEYADYFQHTNLLKKGKPRQSYASSHMPRDSAVSSLYGMGPMPPGPLVPPPVPSAPSMSMYGMPPMPPMSMYGMPPPTMSMYGMPMGIPSMYGMPSYTTPSTHPAMESDGHAVLPLTDTNDPSEAQLRAAVQSFLAAQPSLMQVTKRDVREALAASMPNADLSGRRIQINMMIDELLSGG